MVKEVNALISITNKGDFAKTFKFLNSSKKINVDDILNKYGKEGVSLLSKNTPIDSGKTSSSWSYKIEKSKGNTSINWFNSNVVNGANIAILLQYGHGTQNGGYVSGRDYINPALLPLFDKMSEAIWQEVIKQ